MNGIDKITGRIAGDAKQEAEAILSQAVSEAAAITEKYKAQSQEEAKRFWQPAKSRLGKSNAGRNPPPNWRRVKRFWPRSRS